MPPFYYLYFVTLILFLWDNCNIKQDVTEKQKQKIKNKELY